MQILRQSTQVIVRVGPFVDVGDGFTPQIDISLAGNEAELLKNASVEVDISGRIWAAVTNCRGWYDLTLTTGDTDTVGLLTVVVQDDSDCLPVFRDFQVIDTVPFDEMFKDAAVGMQGVIEVNNLDHLMKVGVSNRDTMPEVVDDTVLANIMTKTDGDTSDFDHATDSLEAIKDVAPHGSAMRGSDVVPRTAQQIRDAMKLDAVGNSPAAGSIDKHLDDIVGDTNELQQDDIPTKIAAIPTATEVMGGTIDEATAGANPTTLAGKVQAIFNRLFAKRTVTESLETAYEKDDSAVMETFDLADDDITTSRTR